MHHMTVIALQSAHRPTEDELEVCLDSLLAQAEHQGFAPLRARAIYENLESHVGTRHASAGDEVRPCELSVTRTVHDGVMQGKWEGGWRALPARERDVLRRRDAGESIEAIAHGLNVEPARVEAIEREARAKLAERDA